MSERIADDRGTCKHNDEIGYFNALIIDLKLQLNGRPSNEEITMERLERGTAMVDRLFACRIPTRFR